MGVAAFAVAAALSFGATRLAIRALAAEPEPRSGARSVEREPGDDDRETDPGPETSIDGSPGGAPSRGGPAESEAPDPSARGLRERGPATEPLPRSLRMAVGMGLRSRRHGIRACLDGGLRKTLEFRLRATFSVRGGRLGKRGAVAIEEARLGGEPLPPEAAACVAAALQDAFDADGLSDLEDQDVDVSESVQISPRGALKVRWSDCSVVGATSLHVVLLNLIAAEPWDVRDVPCTEGSVEWEDLEAGHWVVTVLADSPQPTGALVETEVVPEETVSPVAVLEAIAPSVVRWSTDVPGCGEAVLSMTFRDPMNRDGVVVTPCSAGEVAFPSPELGLWRVRAAPHDDDGAFRMVGSGKLVRTPAAGVLEIELHP